jgi:hypothetical protein
MSEKKNTRIHRKRIQNLITGKRPSKRSRDGTSASTSTSTSTNLSISTSTNPNTNTNPIVKQWVLNKKIEGIRQMFSCF